MRRKTIYPHKSLRYMPFRNLFLLQGLVVAAVADVVLLWQMQWLLDLHTRGLERLLDLANVPWTVGRQISVLPGITANVVNPGPVDTGWMDPDTREEILHRQPGKSLGTPEHIANIVAFLLSSDGAWINGQLIRADGGFSIL